MFAILAGTLVFFSSVSATLLSDSGCSCVVTKTAVTAPGAATTIAAGCTIKPDWLSSSSKWCLTDQVATPGCGTLQAGFGYVDTCALAGFPIFNISGPPQLSPDQTPTTFYTGQILTVNWTSQNIAVDEWLRLTYMGVSLRTLTTGSGVNVTAGTFLTRISDSTNSITPTNGSALVLSTTNPLISVSSQQNITILQSKIVAANVFDENRTVGTGSIVCDNRNVTVQWISAGEANVGIATVTIKSNGGFGGGTTVGTPITGIVVSPGNMTVNYTLPRTFVPGGGGGGGGGGTTYSAQISVQSPGAGVAPYTLSSTAFTLVAAPTPTPSQTTSITATKTPSGTPSTTPTMSLGASFSGTSSITPTVSLTATASLSFGATPSTSSTISVSPSVTPTLSLTPSITPTASSTASITQTPAPTVDYIGIAKAAAAESDAKTGAIVGGAIGGLIGLVVLSFIAFKINQRYEAHLRRSRRLRTPGRNYEQEARNLYGQQPTIGEGTTVMYQVTMPQPQQQQQQRLSNSRGYQSNNRRIGRRS